MNTSTYSSLEPELWATNYTDYLIRFALQRVSDFTAAEDLVQDTFLSGWKARASFRGDCNERTWLTGILRNKIIDLYRKNGRRPTSLATDLEDAVDPDGSTYSWMDQQSDDHDSVQPELVTDRHEFLEDLDEAVDHLPEKMRDAFRMREIEGRSTEEITDTLGISKNNLWVLIHRARHQLATELETEWGGDNVIEASFSTRRSTQRRAA